MTELPTPESKSGVRVVWPLSTLHSVVSSAWVPEVVIAYCRSNHEFLSQAQIRCLVQCGVALVALIGERSEDAHDVLDWALEELGADNVVTSWHQETELEDILSFIAASCQASRFSRVLIVVDESSAFGEQLVDGVRRSLSC